MCAPPLYSIKKTQICDCLLGLSVRVPLVIRHKSKPYSTTFQTLDHIYLPTDPQASRRSAFNLSRFWSGIGLLFVCLTTIGPLFVCLTTISEKELWRSDIRLSSVWNDTDNVLSRLYSRYWRSWIRASRNSYENDQQDALYRLIYCSKSVLRVSGHVFARHQEHLAVFTVPGSVHPSCCRHRFFLRLDVHESVHRDTIMKVTNKMHYID